MSMLVERHDYGGSAANAAGEAADPLEHGDVAVEVEAEQGEPTQEPSRLSSTIVLESTRAALSNLEELKKWLDENASKAPGAPVVSTATRQRAIRKAMLKLSKACATFKDLEERLRAGGDHEAELEAELVRKEELRFNTLNSLNRTAEELQRALVQLKELHVRHESLQEEREAQDGKLRDLEARLSDTSTALEDARQLQQRTLGERNDYIAKFRVLEQNERDLLY